MPIGSGGAGSEDQAAWFFEIELRIHDCNFLHRVHWIPPPALESVAD